MIDRFFIKGPLEVGSTVEVRDKEYHHLANVMRAKVGDTLELINGQGDLARADVVEIRKKQAALKIAGKSHTEKPNREIVLAQALPRLQKLDFIIEKGTELGVTRFWFFPGEKSEKQKLSPNQLNRAEALVISALKQCGRLWQPEIQIKPPLKKWTAPELPFYFGDIRENAPLFQDVWTPGDRAGFCVGPESGLTNDEIEKLESFGTKGVKLNPNILRTETASLLGAGLMCHWIYGM